MIRQNLPRQIEMRGIDHFTTADFLHWVATWTPDSPPPAPYAYSNAGTGLLGYLVAEASHTPWERQVNQEIVGPLGMVDTEVQPTGAQRKRMAQGHRKNGMPAPAWPVYAWYAAGALRSTAADMLGFGEANVGHATVAGHLVPAELTAAMKLAQTPAYLLPDGNAKQGMAWVTNLGEAGAGVAPEILKNGGTVGFGSVILTNPTKDIVIFIAVNKQGTKPLRLSRLNSAGICTSQSRSMTGTSQLFRKPPTEVKRSSQRERIENLDTLSDLSWHNRVRLFRLNDMDSQSNW